MKIAICVKIVQGELNPFDASALECALQMEGVHRTVVCLGPPGVAGALRKMTRLGDFRTVLLSDTAFAGSDTLATSYLLASFLKTISPDVIFCGRQSIDGDTAQTGPSLAARMGFSLQTQVLEFSGRKGRSREGEFQVSTPTVLTFERSYPLRFPSLRSRVREVEILDRHALDVDLSRCGTQGSPTRVVQTFEAPRGRRKCQWISWSELEPLVRELRHQAKKSVKIPPSEKRLPQVCAVGREIAHYAEAIAEEVVYWEKVSVEELVARAKQEKPRVILWNADVWGRQTAPQVAVELETGLCADCTALETDGERLWMYRPAVGGNILAKIECRTRPVMATLRTVQASGEVVIAGGKGVAKKWDEILRWAERWDAQAGASRGLVDQGVAPYPLQIGLTGKSISPKVYLAVGISGAVQHLCAVENADTIIAVNADKNARIFEYADYGIVKAF
ncbi:MAG: FAD-binding protein [Planctomycetia bacterium]|nr:FAD-binding protein [Planctomycetia bacterium]